MDIKLPYQATKTVAAAKAESTDGGTHAFATNVPTFGTTTLSAYMAGDSVAVSWELLQDVGALAAFVTADPEPRCLQLRRGQIHQRQRLW